jgi:hypothetical protein
VVYYPLDEAGNRLEKKFPIEWDESRMLYFSSTNKTIWYEIIVSSKEFTK